jgi:hypothetical protein
LKLFCYIILKDWPYVISLIAFSFFSFAQVEKNLDLACRESYQEDTSGRIFSYPLIIKDSFLVRRTHDPEMGVSYKVETFQGVKLLETKDRILDIASLEQEMIVLHDFSFRVFNFWEKSYKKLI